MREIHSTIVAALIFSKDGKLLLGKKDPTKGGAFADFWHFPGGGVEGEETLEQALIREVNEEVGINIEFQALVLLPYIGEGISEKILKDTGESVLCNMKFNRFEIHIDQYADNIPINRGSEFMETRWFSRDEWPDIQQIPGGKEFFQEAGYI